MTTAKPKILFVMGSLNQTSQMHQVAQHLPEYDAYYTQFFGNHPIIRLVTNAGLMDMSIMGPGSKFMQMSREYMAANNMKYDYRGAQYQDEYVMVIMCTDIVIPKFFRKIKTVWLQEGMVDKVTTWSKIVKALHLPRWFAKGTALNGSSNKVDLCCVASEGYKDFFVKMGVSPEKIMVTGIPNFDNLEQHRHNDFPYKDYVLVTTSDIRETLSKEDRPAFLRECTRIANGRRLIIRLHPNEQGDRARQEVAENCPPDTLVLQEGNTNDMVANCVELITQWSTVVYVGIALGKPVHSWFDVEELYRLAPIQNGGASAANIAEVCRAFLEWEGKSADFAKHYQLHRLQTANPVTA